MLCPATDVIEATIEDNDLPCSVQGEDNCQGGDADVQTTLEDVIMHTQAQHTHTHTHTHRYTHTTYRHITHLLNLQCTVYTLYVHCTCVYNVVMYMYNVHVLCNTNIHVQSACIHVYPHLCAVW